MTASPTPLELRQREELEFDRLRRRSQKFISFDRFAEQYGQAEWQRFKRSEPMAFYRAKFDIQGGPRGIWFDVAWAGDRQQVQLFVEWPLIGGVGRFHWTVYCDPVRDDEGFLRWAMADAARVLSHDCGIETKIQVRGDREAWEFHEEHKYEPPPPCPRALPRLKREAGQFCGTCRARFRTEELAARGYSDGLGDVLPCGHIAIGFFEEDA